MSYEAKYLSIRFNNGFACGGPAAVTEDVGPNPGNASLTGAGSWSTQAFAAASTNGVAVNSNFNGSLTALIPQGSDFFQRIGRKIYLKRIDINLMVISPTIAKSSCYRFLMLKMKPQTFGAAYTFDNLFVGGTSAIYAEIDRAQATPIFDEVVSLDNNNNSRQYCMKRNIPVNFEVEWDMHASVGGNVKPVKGDIVFLCMTTAGKGGAAWPDATASSINGLVGFKFLDAYVIVFHKYIYLLLWSRILETGTHCTRT